MKLSSVSNSSDWLLEGPWLPLFMALIVHCLGLLNGFTFDDFSAVLEHPVVSGGEPFWRVVYYDFLGKPLGEWTLTLRPVMTLLYALGWAIWGANPFCFHLMTLVAFLGVVVLGQRLFKLWLSPRLAMLATLFFSAMAIHVSCVASIAFGSGTFALLFSLMAFHWGLQGYLGRAIFAYLAAMMCKEASVLMPLWLVAHLYLKEGFDSLKPQKKGMLPISLLCVGGVYVLLRLWWLPIEYAKLVPFADNPLLAIDSFWVRCWVPFVLLGTYLSKIFIPADFLADYTYSSIPMTLDLSEPLGWVGVSFCLIQLGSAFYLLRKRFLRHSLEKVLLFSTCGFWLSYVIPSNTVFLSTVLMAERLFLTPSLWLTLWLFACGGLLSEKVPRLRLHLSIAAVVFLLLQVPGAQQRTFEWKNNFTLFRSMVRVSPANVRGQLYLSMEYAKKRRWKEVIWHFGLALRGRSSFPDGFILATLGGQQGFLKGFSNKKYAPWSFPLTKEQRKWRVERKLRLLPAILNYQNRNDKHFQAFYQKLTAKFGDRAGSILLALTKEHENSGY